MPNIRVAIPPHKAEGEISLSERAKAILERCGGNVDAAIDACFDVAMEAEQAALELSFLCSEATDIDSTFYVDDEDSDDVRH